MTEPANSLVFDLLQACAAAAPQPWLPGPFIEDHAGLRDDIIFSLEALCHAGILKEVMDKDRKFAGLLLTPRGAELANDPQAVARLCEAEALDFSQSDSPQRRAVREMFHAPGKPRVNRVLFWLNIAVFLWGVYLASRQQAAAEFIMPVRLQGGRPVPANKQATIKAVLAETGLLQREDFILKRWWRLVSCGFVHIGILHLLMNMYALRILGAGNEWIWGPRRYLLLYFLCLVGGSCAALTTARGGVGGASGALCGLLSAEGVWIFLNRKILPRRMVRNQMRGLIINGLLIGLLSLVPGISGAGHLGGAAIGVAAALLLHWHRFGSGLTQLLTAGALMAMPIGCVLGLQRIASEDPQWQADMVRAEGERIRALDGPMRETYQDGVKLNVKTLRPLDVRPERRSQELLKEALDKLPGMIRRHLDAEDRLLKTPPFRDKTFEEYRLAGRDYFRRRAAFMSRVQNCLLEKTTWDEDQEEELIMAQKRWLKAFKALD